MIKENYISAPGKVKAVDLFFYLFLILIIAHRIFLLLSVNTGHIDCDQPIMWQAARNFSEGLFYEPRYYGQDYNTMLEGLLAAPLLWLNIPVYYAVPVITHILFLSPFLFPAIYLYAKGKKQNGLLVLCLVLCMPVGYDIMNSVSRGFVTGLFFTSFFILSIVNPGNLNSLFLNTFMAYVAYLVNANTLLVSAPFLFYLFLIHYRNKNYYLCSMAALLSAAPVHYALDHFYKVNPEYVHYSFKNTFGANYLKDAITHLDQRFAHISFLIEENSLLLLVFFVLLSVLLYKQNKKAFYAFLVFLALILLTFFSSKVADGFVWAFYSYSRMYLGIPVMLLLFLSLLRADSKVLTYTLICITVVFTLFKEINLKKEIAYHADQKKWGLIHLASLSSILDLTTHYKEVCEKNQVHDLVIAGDHFGKDEIGYGGPGIFKDYPNTVLAYSERRTWRILENRVNMAERFILLCTDYDLDKKEYAKKYGFTLTRQDDYGCFLVEHNTTTLAHFLERIDQPVNGVRRFN